MNKKNIQNHLSLGHLLLGREVEPPARRSAGFHSFARSTNQPSSTRSMAGTPSEGTPLFAAAREGHGMVIAPTGKGKTRNALIPHLLCYPGSTVVIDVKGELTNVTANRRREMGQSVHVLDPFGITDEKSGNFNPFDLLGVSGSETPVEQLAMEIPSMMHGANNASLPDPFWDIRADGLLAGIAGAAETVFGKDERNVVKMREMLMGDDTTYSLAVLLDTKKKQLPHLSYQQIASHLQTEERCRSSILATATQHFGYTYGVEKCLTETSIDLEGLRAGKPVTVYLRDEIYAGHYDRNPAYDIEPDDDDPEPPLPGLSA